MEERKDFPFPIRCVNCGSTVSVDIPWGKGVGVFAREYKEKCEYCGWCGWEKGEWVVPNLGGR